MVRTYLVHVIPGALLCRVVNASPLKPQTSGGRQGERGRATPIIAPLGWEGPWWQGLIPEGGASPLTLFGGAKGNGDALRKSWQMTSGAVLGTKVPKIAPRRRTTLDRQKRPA